MSLSYRIFLAAAIVVVMHAAVYWVDGAMTPEPTTLHAKVFDDFPTVLEHWVGEDVPPDTTADYQEMVNRIYQNPLGEQVLLLTGLWTKYTVVVPHTPEVCYPCVGWQLRGSKDLVLRGPQHGAQYDARLMTYEKPSTERIKVLFWYRFGDKSILDNNQLRQFQRNMRGRYAHLPVATKYMLQTSAANEEQAEQRLMTFASLVLAEAERVDERIHAASQ